MEATIFRDSNAFVADLESGVSYLQIICVWQRGADALLDQYRQLERSLPKGVNLETLVLTKEELMRKFKANDEAVETTSYQINALCKNMSHLIQDKEVHVYIDECWITVPKRFTAHLTAVGHIMYALITFLFVRQTQMRWLVTFPS